MTITLFDTSKSISLHLFPILSLFYIIQSGHPLSSSIQLAKALHIYPVIGIMSSTFSFSGNSMTANNGRSINFICFRAQEFETEELNIVDYTKCLLSRNVPQGIRLSQEEVNQLFEADVRATYDVQDPKRQFLLQQKICPLIMDFWEKYKEPGKFISRKSNEARTSFRALPCDRQNKNKGSILLGDGITKVLIPDIGLLSLHNLSYLDVILKVYQANGSNHIFKTRMGRIWVGIVSNIFHFEVQSMKVAKVAETISTDVKHYWRRVSDYRMALRQQRARPVAADFFDDYPILTHEPDDRISSTASQWRSPVNGPHTTMVDVGPNPEVEEQQYAGMFTNTHHSPSQPSVLGAQSRHAKNGSTFSLGPYQSESHNAVETQTRFHDPVLTNQIHTAADGHEVGFARNSLLPSVRSMQQYLSLQPQSSLPIRPRRRHHEDRPQ